MKLTKTITVAILTTTFLASPFAGLAADGKDSKPDKSDKKAKPYTLNTCAVSDEKFESDSDMKPFEFTYGDREIKLCCKSCKKDFDKEPAKYVKKIEEAEKKAKAGKKS
jgi:hypothetical protein